MRAGCSIRFINTEFGTPSLTSPKSPKVSTPAKDQHLTVKDDNSGYHEERAVKVQALYILIQFFLLREYHLKSQSASTTPLSRSSSSAENDSDSQSEQCDSLDDEEGQPAGSCEGYLENTSSKDAGPQNSQSQKSRSNPQKRGRSDQEDKGRGEDDDEDDQQPNKKRSKQVDLNSLNARLACPFAKGKPSSYLECALIGRQDLSGVK